MNIIHRTANYDWATTLSNDQQTTLFFSFFNNAYTKYIIHKDLCIITEFETYLYIISIKHAK